MIGPNPRDWSEISAGLRCSSCSSGACSFCGRSRPRLLWAVVLCISSWPFYQRLLKLLRGRRTLAALLMALGMILVMLLPFLSWADARGQRQGTHLFRANMD